MRHNFKVLRHQIVELYGRNYLRSCNVPVAVTVDCSSFIVVADLKLTPGVTGDVVTCERVYGKYIGKRDQLNPPGQKTDPLK